MIPEPERTQASDVCVCVRSDKDVFIHAARDKGLNRIPRGPRGGLKKRNPGLCFFSFFFFEGGGLRRSVEVLDPAGPTVIIRSRTCNRHFSSLRVFASDLAACQRSKR